MNRVELTISFYRSIRRLRPQLFRGGRKGIRQNITMTYSIDGHVKQAILEPSMCSSGAPLRRGVSRALGEIARPSDSALSTFRGRHLKTTKSTPAVTEEVSAAWYDKGHKST